MFVTMVSPLQWVGQVNIWKLLENTFPQIFKKWEKDCDANEAYSNNIT